MAKLFEICFYSEKPEALFRAFTDDLQRAGDFIEAKLKTREGGVYCATCWNSEPEFFMNYYLSDRDEIFSFKNPIILTRAAAAALRK